MLPFLKKRLGARRSGQGAEVRYGYSEDEELSENALDELISALERKDHKAVMSALMALIDVIKNKESHDTDAQ